MQGKLFKLINVICFQEEATRLKTDMNREKLFTQKPQNNFGGVTSKEFENTNFDIKKFLMLIFQRLKNFKN